MLDDVIAPLFKTTWGKRTSLGLFVFSIGLILIFLIKMPNLIYSDWLLVHSKKDLPNDVLVNNTREKESIDFSKLSLFGVAPEVTEHLPITSLQLSLLGILHAKADVASEVIISDGGDHGKVYKINDVLPSGVRVVAIDMNGVTLENAGKKERLPLRRTMLAFQGLPTSKLIGE